MPSVGIGRSHGGQTARGPYDLLRVYRSRSATIAGRVQAALAGHRAIVAASSARDPVAAKGRMRAHIANARQSALIALECSLDQPAPARAVGPASSASMGPSAGAVSKHAN
ncbi:FCD domain-containing protein [uncultured Roseicyclus sp.]|uniref:FCD domain-containing protein n=1 Tax=uncultured Roseicyclus sp. TaxID=543072 RepID=UPI0034586A3E